MNFKEGGIVEKRKNVNNNRFKIVWHQNEIYLLIMSVAVIVRWIPISSGNPISDEAINDIAIGAFASALVAWLIDWRTSIKEQHRNEVYRAMLLIPFVKAVVDYMQQFCFKSAFMPPKMRSVRHDFLEWSEYYYQKCSENKKDDEDFIPITVNEMLEIVENVHCTACDIENNAIWLRKENILSRQDMENVHEIDSILYQYKTLCCTGNLLPENIKLVNEELYSQLLKIEQFLPLCTVKYSYDYRLTSYIKSIEQIDSID